MAKKLTHAMAKGEVVKVFGIGQLCSPKIVEMVAIMGGFDAVWLDQEHAGLTIPQIEVACLAVPTQPPSTNCCRYTRPVPQTARTAPMSVASLLQVAVS